MSARPPTGEALGMDGLRTDQAPPLAIPASFFLLAPAAMIAAGLLVAVHGPGALVSRWLPLAMAATHLGTLGFLGSIMLGALYQMTPVVAGAPVPGVRLAHGVHAVFALGVVALVIGFGTGGLAALSLAPLLLSVALLAFLGPVAVALVGAPTRSETVHGMRIAIAGLAAVGTLGVLMALARTGHLLLAGDWTAWVSAHAALGGLVWIGGLITAVSWQVLPMFYLTPPLPTWSRRATLVGSVVALLAAPAVPALGGSPAAVALAVLPAGLLVLLLHPILVVRAVRARKRRRVDGSVRFFLAGAACAPLALPLAAGALFGDSARFSVALGFVVVWGWAALVAHGMLSRIVPFLVWWHRYSPLVGRVPVPSMRGLLPDPRIRLGLQLHVASVGVGLLAILSGYTPLAHLCGLLLAATGGLLGANLIHTLRQRPQGNTSLA